MLSIMISLAIAFKLCKQAFPKRGRFVGLTEGSYGSHASLRLPNFI